MYLQALDNGFVVLEPGVEFIDNLPKVVSVSCCTNMFPYEICDSVIDTRNVPAVVHNNLIINIVFIILVQVFHFLLHVLVKL
jgi:hypothetical protein